MVRTTLLTMLCTLALGGCGQDEQLWSGWTSGKAEDGLIPELNLTREPQTLDPAFDRDLIGSLGLLTKAAGPEVTRFNVLIVGQDSRHDHIARPEDPAGRQGTYEKVMVPGPAGPRLALGSRGDSINILSVDRVAGKVTFFTIYRGNYPRCTKPAWDEAQWGSLYLARLYHEGRDVFIPCMEEMVTSRLTNALDTTPGFAEYLGPNGFQIHALLEANFSSFRKLFKAGFDAVYGDAANLAWLYKGHVFQLAEIAWKQKDIVMALRYRHIYKGKGYQRAFNHAKFLSTVLGYLAFGMAQQPRMLESFAGVYNELSASLSLTDLLASFERVDQSGKSALLGAGYKNDVSPVRIIFLGKHLDDDYVIFENGQTDSRFITMIEGKSNYLTKVNTGIELIPGPNNCDDC